MIIKQRLFLVLIITNLMIFAGQSVFAKDHSRYQFYTPTNEGTGKVYMGREISHVMGFQGAAWLERESRQKEERTDLLFKSLDFKAGMAVADIGAGTGFLSRGMANLVGEKGRVFAVDIQPEMLGKL